jgi:hypothetical protein
MQHFSDKFKWIELTFRDYMIVWCYLLCFLTGAHVLLFEIMN